MARPVVGVHYSSTGLIEVLNEIKKADAAGVPSFWLTSGAFGADTMSTLAVAGRETQQILLGTSVIVQHMQHPLELVKQAVAVEEVAPGRTRLGIGTGHTHTITPILGLPFDHPAARLREYTQVLEQALREGTISFDGEYYKVHGKMPVAPPKTPVLLAALRPSLYRMAGEFAEGAISWASPPAFLRDVARPALLEGAAKRGPEGAPGAKPILIGQCFGLVSDQPDAVIQWARERYVGYYGVDEFYRGMLVQAGYSEVNEGIIRDRLIQDMVVTGSESQVAAGVRRFLDAGCDHLIISVPTDPNFVSEIERTYRFLGSGNY